MHRTERPHVTVRQIDRSYRVVVTHEGLEHTHKTPLPRWQAWDLVKTIRTELAGGRELHLAHWETVEI